MDRNLLKETLLGQALEAKKIREQPQTIERENQQHTLSYFNNNLVKVITGVRRCGKSVFSLLATKNLPAAYVNFDDERLLRTKTEDLNTVLEVILELYSSAKVLIFDEIQNVPGWELFVNRLKRQEFQLVVTGSNSKLLSQELATHLTGRHLSIELFPFSFREFLKFKGYLLEKNHEFKQGGFPEVCLGVPMGPYLRELFDKIVSRDIVYRHGIRYEKTFKELALYALTHFSRATSYQNLCRTLEMKSVHTVKNYFQYLEEAYLLFQVYPYSSKMQEQIKLPKKIYSIDLGLSSSLSSSSSEDLGAKLENLVFLELKRRRFEIYSGLYPKFEVDFVIREGRGVRELIQVCYTIKDEKTQKREVHALLEASKLLGCKNLSIITWDEESELSLKGLKIQVVPAWKYLTNSID